MFSTAASSELLFGIFYVPSHSKNLQVLSEPFSLVSKFNKFKNKNILTFKYKHEKIEIYRPTS